MLSPRPLVPGRAALPSRRTRFPLPAPLESAALLRGRKPTLGQRRRRHASLPGTNTRNVHILCVSLSLSLSLGLQKQLLSGRVSPEPAMTSPTLKWNNAPAQPPALRGSLFLRPVPWEEDRARVCNGRGLALISGSGEKDEVLFLDFSFAAVARLSKLAPQASKMTEAELKTCLFKTLGWPEIVAGALFAT